MPAAALRRDEQHPQHHATEEGTKVDSAERWGDYHALGVPRVLPKHAKKACPKRLALYRRRKTGVVTAATIDVLEALIQDADEHGRCAKSLAWLATTTQRSIATLYRAFDALEALGLVLRVHVVPNVPGGPPCPDPSAVTWKSSKYDDHMVPSCPAGCVHHHGGALTYLTFASSAELQDALGSAAGAHLVRSRDPAAKNRNENPSPVSPSLKSGSTPPPACSVGSGSHAPERDSSDAKTRRAPSGRTGDVHAGMTPAAAPCARPDESHERGRAGGVPLRGVPADVARKLDAILVVMAARLGAFEREQMRLVLEGRWRGGRVSLDELDAAAYAPVPEGARCAAAMFYANDAAVVRFAHAGRAARDGEHQARIEREARRARELAKLDAAPPRVDELPPLADVTAFVDVEIKPVRQAVRARDRDLVVQLQVEFFEAQDDGREDDCRRLSDEHERITGRPLGARSSS
jgi:hypothetical protein